MDLHAVTIMQDIFAAFRKSRSRNTQFGAYDVVIS
jgi:hypothetical protein